MKGHIFVADNPATGPSNVVEIDPSTGKQTLITQGGQLVLAIGLQPGPGNTIFVADFSADGTGAIFQVDLHSGTQTLIASGGYLNQPVDMATSPDGDLVVVEGFTVPGAVVSIDPRTGSQTLISTGGLLTSLNGNSVDRAGDIFVSRYATSSPSTPASIVEVNPTTGAQSIVSQGGYLDFASGQVEFYSNQGQGTAAVQAPRAGAGGAASVTGDAGLALAVALATHGKKGLHGAVADPAS
jgi:hypothetical protein